jgi:hypothetical protein
MSDQTGAETSNADVGDDSTADVWRCSECGQLNENRDSCLSCGRDRKAAYPSAAPRDGKLNKLSLGIMLAIALLAAPALTYRFYSTHTMPPGAGLEVLIFISTPFCAALVMILVAAVMIIAVRRQVKRPFVFGLITIILAYLILWIIGHISVVTF